MKVYKILFIKDGPINTQSNNDLPIHSDL